MKNRYYLLVVILTICSAAQSGYYSSDPNAAPDSSLNLNLSLNSMSLSHLETNLEGSTKRAWKTSKKAFNGLLEMGASSIGICLPDHHVSLRVYNDTTSHASIFIQTITNFMGTQFIGTIKKNILVPPYGNSGSAMYNMNECYGQLWIMGNPKAINNYKKVMRDVKIGWEIWTTIMAIDAGMMVPVLGSLLSAGENALLFYAIVGPIARAIASIGLSTSKYYIYDNPLVGPEDPKIKPAGSTTEHGELPGNYHVYTIRGTNYVEQLGPKVGRSSDFGALIVNSTDTPVDLSFTKDAQPYSITIDPYSFNELQATPKKPNSMRPLAPTKAQKKSGKVPVASLKFSNNKKLIADIPIAPSGIGQPYVDKKGHKHVSGYPYTYGIYKQNGKLFISMQGYRVGHHDQAGCFITDVPAASQTSEQTPLEKKLLDKANKLSKNNPRCAYLFNTRDLNPVACNVWMQPIEDNKDVAHPYGVWFAYITKGQKIVQKLKADSINKFNVIRPKINEHEGHVYIFAPDSDDASKINTFVTRLSQGLVGTAALSTNIGDPLKLDPSKIKLIPNQNGFIKDHTTGITAQLLGADLFANQGLGSKPVYYTVPPQQLESTMFTGILEGFFAQPDYSSVKDKGSTAGKAALQVIYNAYQKKLTDTQAKFTAWIQTLYKNSNRATLATKSTFSAAEQALLPGLVADLTTTLKANGADELFTNPTAKAADKRFSAYGLESLKELLFGPISINNYPAYAQSASNTLISAAPASWPKV
ncbi:hypothetical protein HOL34_03225 [bacterium]|jgi:hypothetical protein|nr:hypothetical protein [bacterium]MBT3903574.1 hypothetical protein [bacterium]MBT4577918.1 hypothetical protein [bacterium]MBT5345717.1 hypothetical protein [bacterium]MBT6130799.1 hypothetical protein [bacterium]